MTVLAERSPGEAELRRKLVLANRIAYGEGLFEAFGHISARIPGTETFLIAPRISPALAREETLLRMDLEGQVVEGNGRPNMEVWIHIGIYRARPDVQVVVHAHPPYCVAIGNSGRTVRPLYITGTMFTEEVPVYRRFGLINRPERGDGVAAALGSSRAMLLRGHGANTVGATIEEALVTALVLEESAVHQWRAEALGTPTYFTQDELDATAPEAWDAVSYERAWDYYLSRADVARQAAHQASPLTRP